jgi:hypothetical protein
MYCRAIVQYHYWKRIWKFLKLNATEMFNDARYGHYAGIMLYSNLITAFRRPKGARRNFDLETTFGGTFATFQSLKYWGTPPAALFTRPQY